jgi:DnaJ domain
VGDLFPSGVPTGYSAINANIHAPIVQYINGNMIAVSSSSQPSPMPTAIPGIIATIATTTSTPVSTPMLWFLGIIVGLIIIVVAVTVFSILYVKAEKARRIREAEEAWKARKAWEDEEARRTAEETWRAKARAEAKKRKRSSVRKYPACYSLLGLSPGCTEEEAKSAFWRMAKKYHPDVNKRPGAAEKFRGAKEAYDHVIEDIRGACGYTAEKE